MLRNDDMSTRKKLFERPSRADNYTDPSFLSGMKKNGEKSYTFVSDLMTC